MKGTAKTEAEIRTVFQYLLDYPTVPKRDVCRQFGASTSAVWKWLKCAPPNPYLAKWLSEDNHLAKWQRKRSRMRVGAAMLEQVRLEQVRRCQAQPVAVITAECATTEPPAAVAFTPQTPGDLLVIREEILNTVQSTQVAFQKAQDVLAAIDLVREALTDKTVIRTLEAEKARLENQLALADAQVKQLQSARLQANQIVHSRD